LDAILYADKRNRKYKRVKKPFSANSTVCGKYKIVRIIGIGGMRVVYEAAGPLGSVAVRVPNSSGDNPPEVVVEMLIIEREVLRKLNHPAHCQVH